MWEIIENGPFYIRKVIILAILFSVIQKATAPHDVVLPAIGMEYAEGMARENENYIVRTGATKSSGAVGWYYMDGEEKKELALSGRNPAHELSGIFLQPDRNTFVVTSRIDEELTRKNGCLTLDVKQWYPVAPIKRDYKSMENHEKERIFYPSGYLDAYDLEQGDYVPVIIHRDIDYYSNKVRGIE